MRSPIVFALLALTLLPVASLRAGASNKNGNPFGNGSFFSDAGTFSAVIRSSGATILTTNSTGSNSTLVGGSFLGVVAVSTSAQAYTNSSTNGAASSPNSSGWATVFTPGFIVTTTNSTNAFPSSQWSGPAFGVTQNNQLAVTYSLQNTVNAVFGTNSTQTPQVLSTTNINGAGQFTATLQNKYPNQTFTGTGFCSIQPALAGNPTSSNPIVNFSNTVTGWRLSQQ